MCHLAYIRGASATGMAYGVADWARHRALATETASGVADWGPRRASATGRASGVADWALRSGRGAGLQAEDLRDKLHEEFA